MSEWTNKEDTYCEMFRQGRISSDLWKYIPRRVLPGVADAFADSDGYWIFLDHESGGWVAYDGDEDCGLIHEYTISDLRAAIKTIRKGE